MEELLNSVTDENIDSVDINFKEYLTFKLGNEVYGAQVGNIREVIEYGKVFLVPNVPEYIEGVMNLRGSVVPVIDLSARFYNKKSVITKFSCIVITEIPTEDGTTMVGVVIDAIKSVANLKEEDIENAPSFGAKIDFEYIEGVAKIEDQFVILLNLFKVLNIDDLAKFL